MINIGEANGQGLQYGDLYLGHYWLKQWFVVWQHQTIMWTTVYYRQWLSLKTNFTGPTQDVISVEKSICEIPSISLRDQWVNSLVILEMTGYRDSFPSNSRLTTCPLPKKARHWTWVPPLSVLIFVPLGLISQKYLGVNFAVMGSNHFYFIEWVRGCLATTLTNTGLLLHEFWKQTSAKFESKYIFSGNFIWKCRLQSGGHFVS